jgi:hypothetical protein
MLSPLTLRIRKEDILKIILIILIGIFYSQSLVWLFSAYTGSLFNALHLYFFIAAVIVLYQHKHSKQLSQKTQLTVTDLFALGVFALLHIANSVTIDISIVSALLCILSIIVLCRAYVFTEGKAFISFSVLLLFTLPVSYYVNVILGPLIREIYATVIAGALSLVSNDVVKDGTTIIHINRYAIVDSGCSGIRNMLLLSYFLVTFGITKQLQLSKIITLLKNFTLIFIAVNTVHLVVVSYLFLITKVTDIVPGHQLLGFFVSLLSLIATLVLYYRNNEKV